MFGDPNSNVSAAEVVYVSCLVLKPPGIALLEQRKQS